MKKIILLLFVSLLTWGAASAQSKTAKGKKKESPVIAERQKLREKDYRTFDRFTSFSTKDTNRYFTPFDYSTIANITQQRKPEWGDIQPVMNYLEKVSRATMTLCLLYAVNPAIASSADRSRLSKSAASEALAMADAFEKWKTSKGWRNKVQYKVVEVDYRYFKGASFDPTALNGDVIHVGCLIYLGSKKKSIISTDQSARTFPDIKFFPNDATIVESWNSVLDDLSNYLKENDTKGVLLTGYTDNSGTEAYATGLSRQRAVEIRKALVSRGIDPTRIEIEALGAANPIGDNSTYEGRVMNNRVSIKIQ
ncbi:MAG: OmpA family protein [Bacteroidales bacterium]|nr:OmpA family protein [Bacteroidales bacterium]